MNNTVLPLDSGRTVAQSAASAPEAFDRSPNLPFPRRSPKPPAPESTGRSLGATASALLRLQAARQTARVTRVAQTGEASDVACRVHLRVPAAPPEQPRPAARPAETESRLPLERESRGYVGSVERAVILQQQATGTGRDRREFPRRESGCSVAVCRRNATKSLTAQEIDWQLHAGRLQGTLFDISMSGLAFSLSEPLQPGEELRVRIRQRPLEQGVDANATVIRVVEGQSGQWNVYCRLLRKLQLEQVQQLGKQILPSAVV